MATDDQKLQVKRMLVDQLRLRMDPEKIENGDPLFGEGLGLDSVDAIELVTALEQSFGVMILSEDEAKRIFESVDTLTDHIVEQGGLS